jgi:hypothetical protein
MESEEPTYLILRDGSRLGWLEKKYELYLNKMTLLFGSSESGKSIVMDEIMWLLRPHVPVCYVVAPTNDSNQAYTNKVPKMCIKDGDDLKKLVTWLEDFVSRQKDVTQIYNNANNMENLQNLFARVADDYARSLEKLIIRKATDSIIFISSSNNLNFAQKKTQKASVEKDKDKMLKKIYKTSIRYHKLALEKCDLTKKERNALMFLDVNPRVLLVLDDCASKFKQLFKMTVALKEIFYEGRHFHISTIICSQDDKEIKSEFRKNSMVNIFTTAQAATAAFERASNSYPKHVRERSKLCIETVFKQDAAKAQHYQKLIYIQNLCDPFKYTIADLYDDYRMCAESVWELAEKVDRNAKIRDIESNKFFERYS